MALYEIVTIINPNETDDGVDAIVGGLRQQVGNSGGTVLSVSKWGRKRLAYPIAGHDDAIYVLLHAEGPGNVPADFRAHTKIRESILREMVVLLEDAHEEVVRKELEAKGPEDDALAAAQIAAAEERALEKRALAAASVAETLAAAAAEEEAAEGEASDAETAEPETETAEPETETAEPETETAEPETETEPAAEEPAEAEPAAEEPAAETEAEEPGDKES